MYKGHKPKPKKRLLTPQDNALLGKMPYAVKGSPNTILYITQQQAALRDDLIPNFRSELRNTMVEGA